MTLLIQQEHTKCMRRSEQAVLKRSVSPRTTGLSSHRWAAG
jgi:hypothetical protein